jgi:hypothetical protein
MDALELEAEGLLRLASGDKARDADDVLVELAAGSVREEVKRASVHRSDLYTIFQRGEAEALPIKLAERIGEK